MASRCVSHLFFGGRKEGWWRWDVVNVVLFFWSSPFFHSSYKLYACFLWVQGCFFLERKQMKLTRIIKQLFLIEVQFFTKTWANWDLIFFRWTFLIWTLRKTCKLHLAGWKNGPWMKMYWKYRLWKIVMLDYQTRTVRQRQCVTFLKHGS